MKQITLFVALLLVSVIARAEVYKCKTQEGVVYSEQPCANNATVVNNLAKKPSEENVRAAQTRLANDIHQVEEKEKQERQERQARESRQGARVIAIVVSTHSSSTTVQTYGQNQNTQAPVSQTTSKTTDNRAQVSRMPR